MSNYYNLDGIKTEMKKQIAKEKAFLSAWENVTFPTKKDGKPFAQMSKNFEGCKYTKNDYAMQDGENKIIVYTNCRECGYIHDEINVYELVRYLKDGTMIAKTENYMPKQTYLEQVYKFDINDCKKAIAARIEYLQKNIADMEKQLENADKAYNIFVKAYKTAVEDLERNTDKGKDCTLYYAILDTVKECFPYC